MSERPRDSSTVEVWVGEVAHRAGTLTFARRGARESSSYAYDDAWLEATTRFEISPDLPLTRDRKFRKAQSKGDSVFPFAIADTEPDGWGRRVIARDHAKRRKAARDRGREPIAALTELDYLLSVDDFSRVGALRFRTADGLFERAIGKSERATPPLLELGEIIGAAHALERGIETERDLRYLRGRGTSLGGLRPKCSVIDDDGGLAIGKFPSVEDDRAVTKGEVLALRLAALAGIDAASARVIDSDGAAVALIRRFDRAAGGRLAYLSATSMLQASRIEDHSYTEIADRIISVATDVNRDLAELWRRIVLNMLITNVDDHLSNHGFLYVGNGQWRLAPAFDLNPFPDKDRELKTWLTPDTGPTASIGDALNAAAHFHLDGGSARRILSEVVRAVSRWREMAVSDVVAMTPNEVLAFEGAFEHDGMAEAKRLLRG